MTLSSRCIAKWVLAVSAAIGFTNGIAQDAPIEAVLSKELTADRLAAGSTFSLKVRSPWQHDDCRLSPGMLLRGTIQSVTRGPSGHVREFAFSVDAPCADKQPLKLVVTSLLAPPRIETLTEQFPSYSSFGGGGGAQLTSAPLNFNAGATARGAPLGFSSIKIEKNKLPPTVTLGEVWHLPKIKLVLPLGSSVVSTVATTANSLHLPDETVVVLQRARSERAPLTAVPIALTRTSAEAPRSIHPFLSPCRTGRCGAYAAASPSAPFGFRQLGPGRDITGWGFRTEHDREVPELGSGTTVHFLGDSELLITFPTHALVKRTGSERPTDNPRSVRAVLFDLKAGAVERILDWVIDDHERYVWPFGRNVLVHDGGVLRLYGPGLHEIATLPLDVPLWSLRASPDGEHLLIGELHELHTAEEHRLLESDKHGPQEEVVWSMLDGHLQRIRKFGTSSNLLPTPVLLNDGMIELRKGRDPEWFLVGRTLQDDGEKQLGGFRSSCLPVLNDVAPDLLTLDTCDVSGDGMHTFVVREDGSPVLEHTSGAQYMPVSFVAASGSPKLAMMITRGSNAYSRGLLFHLSAIQHQEIEVLGAEHGEVVARLPIPEVVPYCEPFALSPDGGTLALLSGKRLYLFALQN